MERAALAAVVVAGMCAGETRADTVPQLVGIPDEYTPGTPFSFEIRAPGLPDFTGFTIPVVVSAAVPDPDLSASAVAGGDQYPFPSTAGFTATPTPPGSGETAFTLTISDSGPRTFTTPDTKDLLATVTVTPGAGLTGPIQISFGSDAILLYNMEGRDDELPGGVTVEQAVVIDPVPAPPGVVLLAFGGLVLAGRRVVVRSLRDRKA